MSKSGLLARQKAERELWTIKVIAYTEQQTLDAVCLALAEGFGFGEERLKRCFLIWRKLNIPLEGFSMAPVEYAWTSFNLNATMCEFFSSGGSGRGERFHPTQKPVDLYTWIFKHYAKPSDRILDTHLGSGSSRIAAYSLGFDFVGCEIDETYFELEEKRFETFTSQQSLFY